MTLPNDHSEDMQRFLQQVREEAGLSSAQEAERLARATFSALSEAVTSGQANELGAGLPEELHFELGASTGQAERFDLTGFLDRISGEIDTVDGDEVQREVRSALQVVRGWAPEGEIDDTIAQLPKSLAELFR